jgi:hypothetical protein
VILITLSKGGPEQAIRRQAVRDAMHGKPVRRGLCFIGINLSVAMGLPVTAYHTWALGGICEKTSLLRRHPQYRYSVLRFTRVCKRGDKQRAADWPDLAQYPAWWMLIGKDSH